VSVPIHREPFLVAMHESHHLARCDEISLTALIDDPFIVYRGSSRPSVADEIIELCVTAGFHPRIHQDTGEMQTAVSLVATGMGVTLVAESINRLLLPGVVYRPLAPIDGRRPTTTLYAIYRSDDHNPVLAAFLQLTQSLDSQLE
jgi:DNA-binding transcriptional LysR family regulator